MNIEANVSSVETNPSLRRPLKRFKVLDLTHARAGPVAVRQLSDWGAQVRRVERVEATQVADDTVGKRSNGDFQNLHRNKRSISLDLKTPAGVAVFMKLAADSDVIVENMRADVKHRLGIDYESVRKVNPRIVYGSISGYGQDGPYRDRGGVDQIAQGIGGLMSVTGVPGHGPLRVGIAIADITSGMFMAQGILVALLEREATGQGTWVKTSLLQATIAMLDNQAMRYLVGGYVPKPVGNNHPTGVPGGTYECANGQWINVSASSQRLFARFCEAMSLQHLMTDSRFILTADRRNNADDLRAIVRARLKERPSQDWIDKLNAVGVPCGPVLNIEQVFDDPQVKHMKVAQTLAHPTMGSIRLVGSPIDIEGASKEFELPTPDIGEHSDAILAELGYGAAEIAELHRQGVI